MNELEKVREAAYPLGRMTEGREIRDTFRFKLSAFVSASRSVLQYAVKAARQHPGGQAWFDAHMGQARSCPDVICQTSGRPRSRCHSARD